MQTQLNIEALAYAKLQDAELLLENNRFDSAYYLAGYAIELLLKARVCKTLGIPDFFNFDNFERERLKKESVITRPYRVHDYMQLLILSGIYPNFKSELEANEIFVFHWSTVVKWNENSRYLSGGKIEYTKDFISSVKAVMAWIQRHL